MGSERVRVACRLTVAVAIACSFSASVAYAAPSAADRETARALMDEGRAAEQKKDYKGALAAYKGADAIMHVPTTGIAVAKMHEKLGQLVEARDAALAVTRIPVEPKEPAVVAEGRKQADELASALAPRIPTWKIEVKIPAGFTPEVKVDDANVPYDALIAPRRLNPGHHVVIAKAANVERKAEVDLAEKDAKSVTLEFPADLKMPVVVAKPAEGPGAAPAKPTKTLISPLVWIGLGVAGAGAIVGGITGAISLSSVSTAKEGCRNGLCPPATHGDLDSAQTTATISNIGFIVAGVGAATAVVGLVVGGKRVEVAPAPATATQVTPSGRAASGGPWGGVTARPYLGAGQAGVVGQF